MRLGEACVAAIALAAALSAFSAAWAEVPEQFRVRAAHAKADPYLGDPGLDAPRTVQVEATAEETARGFIVFAKSPGAAIPADYVPRPNERCTALEARDCAGQYGPVTFTILALKGARFGATATDLAGPTGARIAAENLDVRAVRYAKVAREGKAEVIPLLLEAPAERAVPEGRLLQFWITYYVPPGTAPGVYEGQVRILADGAEKMPLPLRLRVNPFALVEPDVSFFMYYGGVSDLPTVYKWLADQRCHGMNEAMVDAPVTREGELKAPETEKALDMYKQAGFARPEVRMDLYNRITAEWLNTPDQSIRMWGPWFRYYPFSKALDDRFVNAVRTIDEAAHARGMRLVLGVADEAGSHAWTIPATQHYNALVKEAVPDVIRYLTVGGGWASGEREEELWKGLLNIWSTNRWLQQLETVKRAEPDVSIEVYNMAGAGSAPGGLMSARNVFGFFLWRAHAQGASQWVYCDMGSSEHNYAWPAENAADGTVPTPRGEAVREGTKDRRYLATLEARLAGAQGAAADEARKFLAEIADKIELKSEDYDPISGGRVPALPPEKYDEWRAKISDLIEALPARGQ